MNDFLPFDLVRFPTLSDPRFLVSQRLSLLEFRCSVRFFDSLCFVLGLPYLCRFELAVETGLESRKQFRGTGDWRIEVGT